MYLEKKTSSSFRLIHQSKIYRCRSRNNCRRVFGRTMTIFPVDVIDVLVLRCSRRKTVPSLLGISSSSSRLILERPKSATTTCPSDLTKQLELFKSRWMMLHE